MGCSDLQQAAHFPPKFDSETKKKLYMFMYRGAGVPASSLPYIEVIKLKNNYELTSSIVFTVGSSNAWLHYIVGCFMIKVLLKYRISANFNHLFPADYKHFLKISFKSVNSFSSYFGKGQTDQELPAINWSPWWR